MAEFPQSIADYIAGLTDEDFINGGHRTNFIPTNQGSLALAMYVEAQSVSIAELATIVQSIADAAAAGSGSEVTKEQIWAGADAQYMSIRRLNEALVPQTIAFAAPLAWDMATGINFTVTLTGDTTMPNPTNQVPGKSGFINFVQGAGPGGRSVTSWGTHFKWFGPLPEWASVAGGVTKVAYFVTASGQVEMRYAGSAI
jgi:hypothetical protein